jgi:hypothetical protein
MAISNFKLTTYRGLCVLAVFAISGITACDKQAEKQTADSEEPPVVMKKTGWLDARALNEASGMQASYSYEGDFFVHNDEGKPAFFVIDSTGNDLGKVAIEPARNKDWEDVTSVPVGDERWIVAGDIGDNSRKREYITLYFAKEPKPDEKGRYSGQQLLQHRLDLTYPDGPRDCEAMSYDPVGNQILLLTKRDKPARLYAVDLQTALTDAQAELKFLGPIAVLRPPTISDRVKWGGRLEYISQPTGLDISPDGTEASVISYRSLYRFRRQADEDWLSALQRKPTEVVGPPAPQNEAVAYSTDGKYIFVTTEKLPAPIFRFQFNDEDG